MITVVSRSVQEVIAGLRYLFGNDNVIVELEEKKDKQKVGKPHHLILPKRAVVL